MPLPPANIIERVLGLDRGFLAREGELGLDFNPHWPGPDALTPYWNLALGLAAVAWVVYVYRREGRSRPVRVALGVLRGVLLGFVLFLLNNPVITLGQSRTEPSVLAVMLDDSVSMRVKDAAPNAGPDAPTRLEAAVDLLAGQDAALLRELGKAHQVKVYTFDKDARPVGTGTGSGTEGAKPQADAPVDPQLVAALRQLKPEGQNTQLIRSLGTVLADLQGQRLAGIVVLTDGRETPAQPIADALRAVKNYGVKVYPVAVGSDDAPTNIDLQAVNVQDSAFKDDLVSFKVLVRGTGYPPGHQVQVRLKDKKTGAPLRTPDGRPSEKTVTLPDARAVEEELLFKPDQVGPLDIVAEAVVQPGELDEQDNTRTAQVAVLDAKVNVLYVDGYPRWEYRYIKNEMIRDKTVNISCLLTSADPSFAQEGDPSSEGFPGPIKRFPESIEEMMQYDVVLFGDVDPRQFTDSQLQLIADFVSKRGGGFGMVAGPRWSPAAYRNTIIEAVVPVSIARAVSEENTTEVLTEGFRPVLTQTGAASSVFRFSADRAANEKFLKEELQPMFWYAKGITTKPGVGEVYAEHPADTAPDGRRAPLLVFGRFGAGRTLFSAIDDSWRWRFYTGESVFDTYWVQQLRYLARSKKLGQRRLTFTSNRPAYEQFEQVRLQLRVLDPVLLQQLPEAIDVEMVDEQGQAVRRDRLLRQEGQPENYAASFAADKVGRYTMRLAPIAGDAAALDLPVEVIVPRLELTEPQVDRQLLTRLAAETLGQPVSMEEARTQLPALVPSAAKVIPIQASEPLWDAPLAMWLFVLLITAEWVLRKAFGML